MKTENPKEQFVKYTKVLKIYIPNELSKKTRDYRDWLKRGLKNKNCCLCGAPIIYKSHAIFFKNYIWYCSNPHCLFGRKDMEETGFPVWVTDSQRKQLKKSDYLKVYRMGQATLYNFKWIKIFNE